MRRRYSDFSGRINRLLTSEFFLRAQPPQPLSLRRNPRLNSTRYRSRVLRGAPIRRWYTDNVLFERPVVGFAIARQISMHLVNKIESRRSEQPVIMQLVFCIERYARYFFLFCQHHRETLALLCNFVKWDVKMRWLNIRSYPGVIDSASLSLSCI